MTEDQEQAAALRDIARVGPTVEKLRGLLAAAMEAESASRRRKRRSTEPSVAPSRPRRRSGP